MVDQSIYQHLLEQATQAAAPMASKVAVLARQSIRAEAQLVRNAAEREQLELSFRLLETQAAALSERFPAVLSAVFRRYLGPDSDLDDLVSRPLRLDQLELMDEGQVQERVELARMLQHVMQEADVALTDLNGYVSALVGLQRVCPERNPLRPDSYVTALQQVMTDLMVPTRVRATWLHHMAPALGRALAAAYQEWTDALQRQGVRCAGFAVIRTPDTAPAVTQSGSSRAPRAVWTQPYRQTVLTLDKLRRLMAGELDTPSDDPKAAFAQQFSREFESGAHTAAGAGAVSADTGFAATVPAALDALKEMQQVDVVMQRMQQRPAAPVGRTNGRAPAEALRDELAQSASSVSQVLSLEVVSLMVETLVQDKRLPASVRKVIERLEPALLRLVIIDPRFFIDQTHPARRLLQEISQRGLAFVAEEDAEFQVFLLALQRHVSPLAVLNIDSAQPFEAALKQLLQDWDDPKVRATLSSQINSAATVLGYAEARNLRAAQMADSLKATPEMRRVPVEVADFLCGPWAQVLAQAELKSSAGLDDPGGYKLLGSELLWSAQPALTRKDVGRLTKLVPRLLSGLREGLGLIGYPSTKTSVFFDVLMKLHHQAFRAPTQEAPVSDALAAGLLGSQDHWVAPSEAKASGFMVFPDEQAQDTPLATVEVTPAPMPIPMSMPVALKLGMWIEIQIKDTWQRMQLSWISPHGTMFLFTSARGKTQSMTQRFFERMLAEGKLRVVSDQASMLDGALDAVVHTAILNSFDSRA